MIYTYSTNGMDFLIHADRSQHKYVGKVTSNGKTRYFYSEEEYNAYLENQSNGWESSEVWYDENGVAKERRDVTNSKLAGGTTKATRYTRDGNATKVETFEYDPKSGKSGGKKTSTKYLSDRGKSITKAIL